MKNVQFNYKKLGIQCLLHTQCNLACKFCFETKEKGIREDTLINIDYIKKLPNQVNELISPIIKKNNIDFISVFLMGGELLSDNISDEVFESYHTFCKELKYQLNIDCRFSIVTNGVFTKYDRVEKFITDFNMRLIFSYDPVDRFTTDAQKQMWYNTYQYFKDKNYNVGVSILLTKHSINQYIKGDKYFQQIPPDVYIDANIYVPRLDYQEYIPGDDDIYNFYKWAIDNGKFNISDINSIIRHSIICNQEYYFMFGEKIVFHQSDCLEGLPFPKEEYYGCRIEDDCNCLENKQPLGIQKRGCLICEHYMNCSEMCWSQILFKDYQLSECPIRRIYQYIENNPSVMNKYNEWNDKYGERYREY